MSFGRRRGNTWRMTIIEPYKLTDRYLADQGSVFMTGIQALARLPLEQLRVDRRDGLNTAAFVSGYPGSPLGGYSKRLGRRRPRRRSAASSPSQG